MFILAENPKLAAKIVKEGENTKNIDNLIELFSSTFFDNIAEKEIYETNLMKFYAQLIEVGLFII